MNKRTKAGNRLMIIELRILLFFSLLLLLSPVAEAAMVHDFHCDNCHPVFNVEPPAGLADTLCLLCHSDGNNVPIQQLSAPTQNTNPPSGLFEAGDASNLMGSYPLDLPPGIQTSHMWSSSDTKPEAGALPPLQAQLNNGLFDVSQDKITCSRCHNPHDLQETNPQLLRTGAGTADTMCLDCHRSWNIQNNRGRETHPMVADYAAVVAAKPDKMRILPDNFGSTGDINLVAGNRVSCTSCHGIHWTDSDASTLDGKEHIDSLNAGDGRLLKHDGPERENPDQSLCQTCHNYSRHGGNAPTIGCMVCHGSHEYDPLGNPNYFMLKKQVTLNRPLLDETQPAEQITANLDYTTLPAASNYDGYDSICLSCHFDNLSAGHDAGRAACSECHVHGNGFAHGSGSSGSSGIGCIECHGHDAGTLFDSDSSAPYTAGEIESQGRGTVQSHSTHTELDSDDLRGPGIYCDSCHDIDNVPFFKSGTDADGDGRYNLAETDVCDNCHSPGGSYNGLVDPAVGAKQIWQTGAYATDGSLLAGKDKWCASCHDEEPSQIGGVYAPNVIGDEDGSYKYGTGWGYYETGHGLKAGETFPSKGGIETLAGRPIECDSCHDYSTAHIDGDARTFDCGVDQTECDPAEYSTSYRLKMVGGQDPMEIPKLGWVENTTDQFRLCAQCHDSGPFTDGTNVNTNFSDRNNGSFINRHSSHLGMFFKIWPADYDFSERADIDGDGDLDLVAASRTTCITCHNVHGSTNLAMIRNGKLIDREPGLEIWYGNEDLAVFAWAGAAPEPENIPLSASTGNIWRVYSAGNVCTGCHIPGMVADNRCVEGDVGYPDCTQPFQPGSMQPPTLDWTGENGYVADGVNPENADAGGVFSFRIKYADINNDAPSTIQLWIDKDADGTYENNDGDPDLDETIDMVEIDPRDVNYWEDGKLYSVNIPLYKTGENTFTYRFHAVGGGDTVEFPSGADLTVSVSNNRPVLSWTGETYFGTNGVSPNTGGLGSKYVFRISYTDADGDCAVSGSNNIQVWIDENNNGYETGEKHNLQEENAGDTDCTDGKIYKLTRTLTNAGPHNYRFYATDGLDTATSDAGPVIDNWVTVNSTANTPPLLEWQDGICVTSGVKPALGAASEDFEFAVNYTDPDGCPSGGTVQVWIDLDGSGYSGTEQHEMSEDDPSDTDCSDGKRYRYTTVISPAGSYDYRFHANDGSDDGVGEATTARTVKVIDAVAIHSGETIQSAITHDVTILVYEGTYTENLSYTTGQGNNSNITLQSICGPEVTTIQAPVDTASTIYIQGVSNPVINGFTISGGDSQGILLNGGVLVKNCVIENNGRGITSLTTSSRLSVEDSVIRNNVNTANGGGIYYNSGGPHFISGSVISDNSSANGGGVFFQNSSLGLTIENTTISNNTATRLGGGVYCTRGKVDANKVTISSNTSGGSGGGLYLKENSTATMTNSNIVDNTANRYGGGVFLGNYNSAIGNLNMTNCTVSNNQLTDTAGGIGGGIYNRLSNVSINGSIFWGNKAAGLASAHEAYAWLGASNTFSFSNSDVLSHNNNFSTRDGSITFDATCIDADPLFVDTTNGDYHLKPNSQAID